MLKEGKHFIEPTPLIKTKVMYYSTRVEKTINSPFWIEIDAWN